MGVTVGVAVAVGVGDGVAGVGVGVAGVAVAVAVGLAVAVAVGVGVGDKVGVGLAAGVGVGQPAIEKVTCWPAVPPALQEYCVKTVSLFSIPTAATVASGAPIAPKITLKVEPPSRSCTS